MTYYTDNHDYSSCWVPYSMDIEQIHKNFMSAIEDFDDWAGNYHKFIRLWIEKYKDRIDISDSPDERKFKMPRGYEDYEVFNYTLRKHFNEGAYPFLYQEFKIYLKMLLKGKRFSSSFLK